MKMWRMLIAVQMALLASQALAENWVAVAADPDDGSSLSVDKDSIRRGDDGLVYYTDDCLDQSDHMAADCTKRLSFTLSRDLIIGQRLDDPTGATMASPFKPDHLARPSCNTPAQTRGECCEAL